MFYFIEAMLLVVQIFSSLLSSIIALCNQFCVNLPLYNTDVLFLESNQMICIIIFVVD